MSNLPKLSRRLHRSRTNRMIAGVLGGIAETYGWDANTCCVCFLSCRGCFLAPSSSCTSLPGS